jgi:hypothetical protein
VERNKRGRNCHTPEMKTNRCRTQAVRREDTIARNRGPETKQKRRKTFILKKTVSTPSISGGCLHPVWKQMRGIHSPLKIRTASLLILLKWSSNPTAYLMSQPKWLKTAEWIWCPRDTCSGDY